jgi:hypothetical protein
MMLPSLGSYPRINACMLVQRHRHAPSGLSGAPAGSSNRMLAVECRCKKLDHTIEDPRSVAGRLSLEIQLFWVRRVMAVCCRMKADLNAPGSSLTTLPDHHFDTDTSYVKCEYLLRRSYRLITMWSFLCLTAWLACP